jgi:hypothetical protein
MITFQNSDDFRWSDYYSEFARLLHTTLRKHPEVGSRVQRLLVAYIENLIAATVPSKLAIKDHVSAFTSTMVSLKKVLADMDEVAATHIVGGASRYGSSREILNQYFSDTWKLLENAEKPLPHLNISKPSGPIYQFIVGIGEVYAEITGKRPEVRKAQEQKGEFFEVLKHAISALERDFRNDSPDVNGEWGPLAAITRRAFDAAKAGQRSVLDDG